jgi:hypothetical protein
MLTCLGYSGACLYALPWPVSYRSMHSQDKGVWPSGTNGDFSSLILHVGDKVQCYSRREINKGKALVSIVFLSRSF